MVPNILGLDLASHSSGMAADGGVARAQTRHGELLDRARLMRDRVEFFIETTGVPRVVVVEALGTRHVQTAQALATVRALVLDMVTAKYGALVIDVPPAVLKAFATGKGNATKDEMFYAAPFGLDDQLSDDEIDAWWLWAIGRSLFNHPPDGVELTPKRMTLLRRLTCE